MTELNELFADIAPDIQKSIMELGWTTPTPVQAAAIPKMREGGDLIVQAMTGSGKTGAFGIPIVEAIDTALAKTQAIILLPTRELANQVAVDLDALGKNRGVRTLPIYGGVAYGPQLAGLEEGAHIVVGTPGRILDHLKNDRMDLSSTKILVLDEADEMLSLGFWPDMKEVASYLPRKRQSHLFSATMPEKVRSLSRFFLTEPQDVTIADEGGPQKIEHCFYMCAAAEKEAVLARILKYENPESAIIFCNTKADVRFITAYLSKRGFNIDQISGDLQQSAREKALNKIKSGKLRFLAATDVAARGIDISDLAYVFNYTTSDSPEVYVHRTGRTGRAGKSGVAVSLISGLDIGNFKFMQTVNEITITEKKVPTERQLTRRLEKREKEQSEESDRKAIEGELDTLREKSNKDLEAVGADDAKARVDRMLPFVQKLAENEEGMLELARFAAGYLIGKPAAAPKVKEVKVKAKDEAPQVEDRETERAREDASKPEGSQRRRSRTGSSDSGGGSGSGGSRGRSGGGGGGGGGRRRR